MVTINIGRKELIGIFLVVVVFAVLGLSYAYNPSGVGGDPAIMGHSLDEMALPDCVVGEAMVKTTGGWGCGSSGGGVGTWTSLGSLVYQGPSSANVWNNLDLSSYVGNRNSLVLIKADLSAGANYESILFRKSGETGGIGYSEAVGTTHGAGVSGGQAASGSVVYLIVETNSQGLVQFNTMFAQTNLQLYLEGFIN